MNPVQIIALALAFVCVANANPEGHPGIYAADYYAYPKYSYSYGVKDALTGDAKSAHETRDGGVVKGSYSLVQPDGVLRTVNYISTPHGGFQAEVINSGPAVHAVAPVVKKAVVPAVAPVVHAHHGYGHHGYAAVAKPLAVAHHAHHHAAPLYHGYAHGGGHHLGLAGIHGYHGHGHGLLGGHGHY